MHHTHMPGSMMFQPAPDWVLSSLGVVFLVFSLFYCWRLLRPSIVRKAIGFWDWEGEIGHAVCMLAMASALSFWLVPIPGPVWVWVLGIGTIYYAARAMTWGRKLSYNKQWWDWTHSGMFLGMFTMFYTLPIGETLNMILSGLLTVFWLWFSLLYVRDSYRDAKAGNALYFGSDLAHLGMGLGMLVMSVFPGLLMSHHQMSQMSMLPDAPICSSTASAVLNVNKNTFAREVLAENVPVVMLISGNCTNCFAETLTFQKVAVEYGSRAKFVRINQEFSPTACKALAVRSCSAVLVVEHGAVKDKLSAFVDEAALRRFVDKSLSSGP